MNKPTWKIVDLPDTFNLYYRESDGVWKSEGMYGTLQEAESVMYGLILKQRRENGLIYRLYDENGKVYGEYGDDGEYK